MSQSPSSAFKPIHHHQSDATTKSLSSSSSSTSSCSSSSSSSSSKHVKQSYSPCESPSSQLRYKKLKTDEAHFHSNGSGGSPQNMAAIAAAAAAAAQLNPFYIDKIFNFQNMFLFSGNGNANDSTHPLNGNAHGKSFHADLSSAHQQQQQQQQQTPLSSHVPFQSSHNNHSGYNCREFLNSHQHASAFGSVQQNLLYNYYNAAAAATTTTVASTPYLNNANFQSQHQPVTNQLKCKPCPSGGPEKAKKNNFSIERILSLPSSSSVSCVDPKNKRSDLAIVGNDPMLSDQAKNLSKSPHVSHLMRADILLKQSALARLGTPMAITAPLPPSMVSMITSNMHAKQRHQAKTHHNPVKSHFSVEQQQQQPVVKSKNAKKYKCDLCGRGFSRSNTLITHRVGTFVI